MSAAPIAIVGMAGRFPAAPDLDAFWKLICAGGDAISDYTPGRTPELDAFYLLAGSDTGPASPRTGQLPEYDQFDGAFFGVSPGEAVLMDPQQRWLLETSWRALEDAGLLLGEIAGPRVGTFIGAWSADYQRHAESCVGTADYRATVLNALFGVSGRLAFALDLRGPEISINAGCASSLIAVHEGVEALRSGVCDLALAGGVNGIVRPESTQAFSRIGALSRKGVCAFGDAGADGFVRSEGVAVVVMKRLADALADGDRIHAVVRGSAVNNNGASSGFLMRPGVIGQAEVLRAALAAAGLSPADIQYVEAHGTGTPTGDPIELAALSEVYGTDPARTERLRVGSVKSNIGHTEAVSGLAGLIKTVLALKHRFIPPTVHVTALNPAVPWAESGLELTTEGRAWTGDDVRRGAVSSFGLTGANAHLIVEEAPPVEARACGRTEGPLALPVSARSADSLRALALQYAAAIEAAEAPEAIIASAAARRTPLSDRLAVVAETPRELAGQLRAWAEQGEAAGVATGSIGAEPEPGPVFVFPGQGAQWIGMGRELLAQEPAFRTALERCDAAVRAETGWSVIEHLTVDALLESAGIDRVQPVLFSLQVALAEMWRSWGVEPAVVVGHSMGEIAAACVAGALPVSEAVKVICRRSALMGRFTGQGAMALTELSLDEAAAMLRGREALLSIAVNNGPRSTVVAGDPAALADLTAELEAKGVFCRQLAVQVAAHSPQMDDIRDELLSALEDLERTSGRTAIYSTTRGAMTDGAGFDAAYWSDNLRKPVLFYDAVKALLGAGHRAFIEIGPHPVLLTAIEQAAADLDRPAATFASMRRQEPERATLLAAAAGLFTLGGAVDWARVYPDAPVLDLPSYPFERHRYWVSAAAGRDASAAGSHPLLSAPFRAADGGWTWSSQLSPEAMPWLKDHAVRGSILLPASAFVEIAAAAAREAVGSDVAVQGLILKEAVVVDEQGATQMQVALTPEHPGRWTLRFHVPGEGDAWTLAASAVLVATPDAPQVRADGPAFDVAPPAGAVSAETHARLLADLGYAFGPSFQCLSWRRLEGGRVTACARLPENVRASAYGAHPALLDAAFQALAAGLIERLPERVQLIPKSIGRARIVGPAAQRAAFIEAELDASDPLGGDVRLYAPDGALIAQVEDLKFQTFPAPGADSSNELLFHLQWTAAPLPEAAPADEAWLVLADRSGCADALCAAAAQRGVAVARIDAEESADDPFGVRGGRFAERLGGFGARAVRVIDLASLDLPADAGLEAIAARGAEIAALANLAEARGAKLDLVTRGACGIEAGRRVAPAQAAVWGLGGVVANELPALACRLVDLDPEPAADEAEGLAAELQGGDNEARVALHGGVRRVARVARPDEAARKPRRRPLRDGEKAEIVLPTPGLLDQFAIRAAPRPAPGEGEIEIEVAAAGLNFLDVMRAMGLFDPMSHIVPKLGAECCGRVARIGKGVKGLAVGDRVIAITPFDRDAGALSSHVITPAVLAAKAPEGLTDVEAAALPCVYATSHVALVEAGRVRAGETVLIQSATGGVGLSAISVARHLGAEIVASAGNEEKRALLRSMGVDKVLDSRAPGLAARVAELTGGRGADVILNSLAGPALKDSLAALAPFGRFLEIGKRDMWENTPIGFGALISNRALFGIDLAEMTYVSPERVGGVLREVAEAVGSGAYAPLPVTVFPADRAGEAFQLMAAARHVGKIVIDLAGAEVEEEPETAVRADGAYLITGGLGALGLVSAEVLAELGARRLVLVGRSRPTAEAEAAIEALRGTGVEVLVRSLDIGDEAAVRALLDEIAASGAPLRGLIHSAGVLDDGLSKDLGAERFERVLTGKVEGARLLDRLTENLELDFFVLYSSVAALLGNPAQGNYAAANAMLDAIAHDRRARGKPALSLAWGPWAEIGLAAQQDNRGARAEGRGLRSLTPEEGADALRRLLAASAAYLAVMRFDAQDWVATTAPGAAGLVGDLLAPGASVTAGGSGPDLTGLLPEGATGRALALQAVLQHLSALLRLPAEAVPADKAFRALGLDSLMGLELRNRIERTFGLKVPAPIIWNYSTAELLAGYLIERKGETARPAAEVAAPAPVSADTDDFERELAEAEALLGSLQDA